MLDKEQFILTKLAEECSEVAQRALKAVQFGLEEIQEGQEKTNRERLTDELNDLHGVLSAASEIGVFRFHPEFTAVQHKIDKLSKYYKYSQKLGKVE